MTRLPFHVIGYSPWTSFMWRRRSIYNYRELLRDFTTSILLQCFLEWLSNSYPPVNGYRDVIREGTFPRDVITPLGTQG